MSMGEDNYQVGLANLLGWSFTPQGRPNLMRWYPRPSCLRYAIACLNPTLTQMDDSAASTAMALQSRANTQGEPL